MKHFSSEIWFLGLWKVEQNKKNEWKSIASQRQTDWHLHHFLSVSLEQLGPVEHFVFKLILVIMHSTSNWLNMSINMYTLTSYFPSDLVLELAHRSNWKELIQMNIKHAIMDNVCNSVLDDFLLHLNFFLRTVVFLVKFNM